MGVHLRFGTISIRELVSKVKLLNEDYLKQLIWREFYMMTLDIFPQVEKENFREQRFDKITWINNIHDYKAWCSGKTGSPY